MKINLQFKKEYFISIILALLISAMLILIFYYSTGTYVLTPETGILFSTVLLVLIISMISNLLKYKFTKKDALGISLSFFIIFLIFNFGFIFIFSQNLLSFEYFLKSVINLVFSTVFFFILIYVYYFLEEKYLLSKPK